jgi:hypothetical protein
MTLNLMLKHGLWLTFSVAALAGIALVEPAAAASVSAVPSHQGMLPPGNPSESLKPSPSFLSSCPAGGGEDQVNSAGSQGACGGPEAPGLFGSACGCGLVQSDSRPESACMVWVACRSGKVAALPA